MKVKSFERSKDLPNWWVLEVEYHPGSYIVNNNAVAVNLGGRSLSPGEEISLIPSKTLTYPNRPEYRYVVNLQRAPKPSMMED